MGLRTCQNEDGRAWLYQSTSMRPINTAAFTDVEQAEAFIRLAAKRGIKIAAADPATLDLLRIELEVLRTCGQCGEYVIEDAPRPDGLCGECGELTDYDNENAKAEERHGH